MQHDNLFHPGSLTGLRDTAHRIAREHGWWTPPYGTEKERTPGELLMLVVEEAAEALREIREGHAIDDLYYQHSDGTRCRDGQCDDGKPEGFPSELADIIIRVLDMAGYYGIDIEHAVSVKMRFNEGRPWRHGGKAL